jgi:hypothetical protein
VWQLEAAMSQTNFTWPFWCATSAGLQILKSSVVVPVEEDLGQVLGRQTKDPNHVTLSAIPQSLSHPNRLITEAVVTW